MKFGNILNTKVAIKLTLRNGKVYMYRSGTMVRFLNKIRGYDWIKGYIRVSYGKQIDAFGEHREFYNDGEYNDKKEAVQAFKAFLEG